MKDIKDTPILITGGTGFIGSFLTRHLVADGYKFLKIAGKQTSFGEEFDGIDYVLCDLRDKINTRTVLRVRTGCPKVVIHLAADIGPIDYMQNFQADILHNNAMIDAALFSEMVKAGVETVIYASSSMVFQNASRYPYTEEDIGNLTPPTNVYGFSKLLGEYFCKSFSKQYGLNYVILRYHNVYGPKEMAKKKGEGNIHVIPALISKVLSGQYPLEILGNPEATRPFIYIDDAVRATANILKLVLGRDKRVINNDFNVGSGKVIKIVDLARLIWELVGDQRPFKWVSIDNEGAKNSSLRREMDASKIASLLGWFPLVSLREGILKTADWLKMNRQ